MNKRVGLLLRKRRKRRLSTGALALLGVIITAAALPAVASADVRPYWGFNYITASNPNASDCNDGHVLACSGWNYWDRTQVDKRNGGYVNIWMKLDTGNYWSSSAIGGIGVFNYSRSYLNEVYYSFYGRYGIPAYTKVACNYNSGNQSYAQCQGVIN